ncbi:hypothetical protein GPALN_006930 [Globodera pallida]|nr:hypothetical protein GPALN_006930 [Globodera pallida]
MRKLKAAEATKKAEAERLQSFLQEMLKEDENKYCADCEAKQPRWASWNLGVFLCIRCAGLHRNLGVHVSKVKSVTLDSWTPDQIQSMRVMGNAKARAVFECELPPMFRRPQTDQSLEAFIRAKYETKRYIMKDWEPPRIDVADLPPSAAAASLAKKATTKPSTHLANTSDKDDSLFGPFSTAAAAVADPGISSSQHEQQLIDVFTPAVDETKVVGIDDLFGAAQSAPNLSAKTAPEETKAQNLLELIDFSASQPQLNNHHPFQTASEPPPAVQQSKDDTKMSTDQILALFGPK